EVHDGLTHIVFALRQEIDHKMSLDFELTLKHQIEAEFKKEKEDAINMVLKLRRDHYQKYGFQYEREEYIFAHFLITVIYNFRDKFLKIYYKSYDDIKKGKQPLLFQDETKLELINNWNIIYNNMKCSIQPKALENKEFGKEITEKDYQQLLDAEYSEDFRKLLEVLRDDSSQSESSKQLTELREFFIDIFDNSYSALYSLSLWYRVSGEDESTPKKLLNGSYNYNLVELFGLEPVVMSYENTWNDDREKFKKILLRYLSEKEVKNVFKSLEALDNLNKGEENNDPEFLE
ncbi:11919_t:CDS:2, partial [Ambispora leptoticha]